MPERIWRTCRHRGRTAIASPLQKTSPADLGLAALCEPARVLVSPGAAAGAGRSANFEDFHQRADQALDRAKSAGREPVVVSQRPVIFARA